MYIPDEELEKFKEIYRQEYGVSLNDDEAKIKAVRLLKLVKAVDNHLKKKQADKKIA